MAATDIAGTFERIRKSLEANDEMQLILKSFNPPATEDEIAAAERKLKLTFPDELRQLYRLLNGQDEDKVHETPGEYYEAGIFPSVDEGDLAHLFLPLDQVLEQTPQDEDDGMPGWMLGWLPIGSNFGGDNIVIDLASNDPKKRARVLQFNHEYSGALPVAASLGEYLSNIADGLEGGTIRFDEDSGLSLEECVDFDAACGDGLLEGAEIED